MLGIGNVGKINYKRKIPRTPRAYKCWGCGVRGVRLFREYQTFLNHSSLACVDCALKQYRDGHKGEEYEPNKYNEDKTLNSTHEIGWLVAAVPTEDGRSYWGYTSVPEEGVKWWMSLPLRKT